MLAGTRDYTKTINLLRDNFGIDKDDDRTSQLFANIMTAIKNDSREIILINAELEALAAMRDAALTYAKQHYDLVTDEQTGEPYLKPTWDPETLSWSFEARVDPFAYGHLAGRPVLIKVQPRFANNNFNRARLNEELDSKFKAAAKFFRDDAEYHKRLAAIKESYAAELRELMAIFDSTRNTSGMEAVVAKANSLQARIVADLSELIYQGLKKDFEYHPNKDEMLAARAALKRCEVEMLSQVFEDDKPRPILMHIYFQDTKERDPLNLRSLLTVAEPISDTSSDLRDEFIDDKPANCFQVTNQCVFLKRAKSTGRSYSYNFEFGKSESFYRSASWTLLQAGADLDDEDVDPESKDLDVQTTFADVATVTDESDLIQQQKTMLRKFLIQLYKQKLIAALSTKPVSIDWSKTLYIHLSLDTFLSPTWSQQSGEAMAQLATWLPGMHRFQRGIEGTFISGNELKQLQTLRKCFEAMDDSELEFNEDDMGKEFADFIKDLKAANPAVEAADIAQIPNLKVRTRLSYFNAPVGRVMPLPVLRTQIPIAWLDWNNYNYDYNMSGLRLHRRNIREFLITQEPNAIKRLTLENLFAEGPLQQKPWAEIRKLLCNGDPEKIRSTLLAGLQPEVQDKMLTIILCYIRIRDYVRSNAPIKSRINPQQFFASHETEVARSNDRIANSYMIIAANLCVMNEIMGIPNVITCKSGKDRTGMFCILREALIDADNNDMLIENICNAIRYSTNQSLNAMNVPGCVGMQVPAGILSGLKELFGEKFVGQDKIERVLAEQQSGKVGGMGKAAYGSKSTAAIVKITQEQTPTDTSAAPLEFDRHHYWPSQYAGPMIYNTLTGPVAPPPGLKPLGPPPGMTVPPGLARAAPSTPPGMGEEAGKASAARRAALPQDFPAAREFSVSELIAKFEKSSSSSDSDTDSNPNAPKPRKPRGSSSGSGT